MTGQQALAAAASGAQNEDDTMIEIYERSKTWVAALLLSGIVATFYVAVSAVLDPSFTL